MLIGMPNKAKNIQSTLPPVVTGVILPYPGKQISQHRGRFNQLGNECPFHYKFERSTTISDRESFSE